MKVLKFLLLGALTLAALVVAAVGIFVHSLLQGVPGSHAKHGLRIGGPSGFGFSDQQT